MNFQFQSGPYGEAKPSYPASQPSYGPPPPPFGQGSQGGGVLPPSLAGQFQGEMPQQFAPPNMQQFAPIQQQYAPSPQQPFAPLSMQPPMQQPPMQPTMPQLTMNQSQNRMSENPLGQPYYPPDPNYTQSGLPQQPMQQQQPRPGQVQGNRPDGPAFTGANNPAYANVTPVSGQGQQYPIGSTAPGSGHSLPAAMPAQGYVNTAALNIANATFEMTLVGEKLARKDVFSKSDPFVQLISASGDVVYKSEVVMNNQSPRWKPFRISLARIGGSLDQPFTVEVWDWDKHGKGDLIGKAVITMRDLQKPGASIQLGAAPGFHIQNPGKVVVLRCNRI